VSTPDDHEDVKAELTIEKVVFDDNTIWSADGHLRRLESLACYDQEDGGRVQIAKHLGTSRQRISDWLGGRKSPTLEQGLKLQAFLKKQRRRK
jgi:hypothetical protein